MNSKFKKLAVAASVSAAMAAVSAPTHAGIMGAAGEALLVPLVVYATPEVSGYYADTIIEVSIPGSMGYDDVPNIFIDPNTTPTNADATLFPLDEDLAEGNTLHWYWFDHRSIHRLDKPVEVTANDTVTLRWSQGATGTGNRYDGQAGYMVIGTETARRGEAADFNMFGDAWLAMDIVAAGGFNSDGAALAAIPVVPMSDGVDTGVLSINDSVIYKGGIPSQVSPLIAGMRTNRSDGIPDLTAFDLSFRSRLDPSIQVIWIDQNLDTLVPVDVYDSDEVACSASVSLPNELNVIWVPEINPATGPVTPEELFFTQGAEEFCVPTYTTQGLAEPSFVTYYLDEYVDTNADRPESSAVAFTLVWDVAGTNEMNSGWNYTRFGQTILLGHERGIFRQ